ncbi:DUF5103 domain-containing protein [Fulvivirga sp. RKSG066]|uniref:type IX secretion system plug protein n=1 Tax=Fulvivirga aurantia TaxID=2529383 RepID=UPI0012BD5C4B|nr:DUF5103 domain-containing protein [Fulvivirga aurantia]MTI21349.1 DUF5103 domain-containing protein [Fulvivirga aurantia]
MKLISFLILFSSLFTTVSSIESGKKLLYKDATYEDEIRTVQLYPITGNNASMLQPAVAQIGRMNLVLEFDDLVQDPEDYRVKIIHCNQDWTKSRLSSIDYLYDFNEFNINNDQASADTKVSYIHYNFRLPQVKLPGNYLLVAYRGTNENDIILSKRFMVYSNQVSIELTSTLNGLTSSNRSQQQLDFKINYKNYELINPLENVNVTIRKNERWDNAINNLKPSFVRDGLFELEYRFFNFENSFAAGNEYRFFDMRSLRNPGQGVYTVDWNTYPITVKLMSDLPRIYQAYSHLEDINGDFYITNLDAGGGSIYSDYVNTQFNLKTDKPIAGEVYVVGKMNNWEQNTESRMQYNPQVGSYSTDMILKQGWYNYKYEVKNDTLDVNYLEGNHFQAENNYEIFVYYRPLNMRADLLIAYGYYEMNPTP